MSDIAAIESIIQTYFDGLYEGDTTKLASVFHEVVHLYFLDGGKLRDLPRADWLAAVASRPKPKDSGFPRTDRIVAIDRAGDDTAMVKVECSIHPKYFVDYLTLLKTESGWRIVTKTYHVDVRTG